MAKKKGAKVAPQSAPPVDEETPDEEVDETPDEEADEDEVDEPVDEPAPVTPDTAVGDVDIADLSTKAYKGEVPPVILVGYWVRLGQHDLVPEEQQGHIAAVVSSPWKNVPYNAADATVGGYKLVEDEDYIVRVRDTTNALLELPEDAFAQVSDTRVGLAPFG